MTIVVKSLIQAKQAESVQTSQYSAVNCVAVIDKFTITNTSATNALFSCNVVAVGGSAGSDNLIMKERAIAPGETYSAVGLVGQVIEAGGFISTLASTAAALTIRASGREIT